MKSSSSKLGEPINTDVTFIDINNLDKTNQHQTSNLLQSNKQVKSTKSDNSLSAFGSKQKSESVKPWVKTENIANEHKKKEKIFEANTFYQIKQPDANIDPKNDNI